MLKAGQAHTGDANHRLFAIHAKEEQFGLIPLGQKTRTDKLHNVALALGSCGLEPFVERFISHLKLSDPEAR